MEAVVIDAGSKFIKAGFAIPDHPPPLVIPSQMKPIIEDGPADEAPDATVDPIVRGFVKDWDAMEDLLHHVLYTGLGWELGSEGQLLFTDPLFTPKVYSVFIFFFFYLFIFK